VKSVTGLEIPMVRSLREARAMNDQEVIVTASVKTKAGHEDEVAELLLRILSVSVEGPGGEGLISFEVNQSVSDPTLLTSYEKWSSQEALEAHLVFIGPIFGKFLKESGDVFAEPPASTIWKQLGKEVGKLPERENTVIGALHEATRRISEPLEKLAKKMGGDIK
jgi:quinol monooxygenase YgiN